MTKEGNKERVKGRESDPRGLEVQSADRTTILPESMKKVSIRVKFPEEKDVLYVGGLHLQ